MVPSRAGRTRSTRTVSLTRRGVLGSLAGAGILAGTAGFAHRSVSASRQGATPAMQQATPSTANPTVVLVHGGFADASYWNGVIERLQAAGVSVLAPANPLLGIEHDSTYVANVVKTIEGPVLLVGHSYGGLIITNAGTQVENAVGLVYIAAMASDEGEAMLDVAANYPQTAIFSALVPASVVANEAEQDVVVDPAKYKDVFAADLSDDLIRILAISQRPFVGAALATPSPAAAWKTLPSWYAVATEDHAIHPDQQRFYATRMGATTIEVEGASHSVAVSQSGPVADLILSALGTLS